MVVQEISTFVQALRLFSTLDTSAEPARDAVRIWRSKALDQKKSSVGFVFVKRFWVQDFRVRVRARRGSMR